MASINWLLAGATSGNLEDVVRYYGEYLDLFHLPFLFEMLFTPWDAGEIAAVLERYEAVLPEGARPSHGKGNHDIGRIASRPGLAQASVAATRMLTLRVRTQSTRAMNSARTARPSRRRGCAIRGNCACRGSAWGAIPPAPRCPGQGGETAGFSTGEPWLPIHLLAEGDIATQEADPGSMLKYVRELLALRRGEPALTECRYRQIPSTNDTYVFERRTETDRLVVCLNFSARTMEASVSGTVLLSSNATRPQNVVDNLILQPHEAAILKDPKG